MASARYFIKDDPEHLVPVTEYLDELMDGNGIIGYELGKTRVPSFTKITVNGRGSLPTGLDDEMSRRFAFKMIPDTG